MTALHAEHAMRHAGLAGLAGLAAGLAGGLVLGLAVQFSDLTFRETGCNIHSANRVVKIFNDIYINNIRYNILSFFYKKG